MAIYMPRVTSSCDTGVLQSALEEDLSRFPSYAAEVLKGTLLKKLEPKGEALKAANRCAVEKFLASNERCGQAQYRHRDGQDITACSELGSLLGELALALARLEAGDSPISDPIHVETMSRHGPGSSIGAKGFNDLPRKLAEAEACFTSPEALWLFRTSFKSPSSAEVESNRQSRAGARRVRGSKVTCVAKDFKVSRLVCTEPLCNMWCQLAIGSAIETCLRRDFGINLSIQPRRNKTLARLGSIDGSYATIDLVSASDSISVALMKCVLPPVLFEYLMAVRSPVTIVNGKEVTLHMMSTQGNGFTFPLQTYLFACIAEIATRSFKPQKGFPKFSVFGDDIIVPTECYHTMVRYLNLLGFEVNCNKSFSEGPFRESCGGDYHLGQDVRGVYIKRLDYPEDFFSAYNRLMRWSFKHKTPLVRTLRVLRNSITIPDPNKHPGGGDLWETRPWEKVWESLIGYQKPLNREIHYLTVPSTSQEDSGFWGPCKGVHVTWRQQSPMLTYRSFKRILGKGCKAFSEEAWFQSMLVGADSEAIAIRRKRRRGLEMVACYSAPPPDDLLERWIALQDWLVTTS